LGLFMIVFLVAAVRFHPDWGHVARDLLPNRPQLSPGSTMLQYAYFAVALMSSVMFPYETYFYASGAIEDAWTQKDIVMNRIIVIFGFVLGSLLAVGLVIVGAQLFQPANIEPNWPGAAALGPARTMGRVGLTLGMIGMLFAFGG